MQIVTQASHRDRIPDYGSGFRPTFSPGTEIPLLVGGIERPGCCKRRCICVDRSVEVAGPGMLRYMAPESVRFSTVT